MGGGIAQVAAAAGHRVLLSDARADAASRAIVSIDASLRRLVEKQKLNGDDARAIVSRLSVVTAANEDCSAFAGCGLVIEAIVENLDVKRQHVRGIGARRWQRMRPRHQHVIASSHCDRPCLHVSGPGDWNSFLQSGPCIAAG